MKTKWMPFETLLNGNSRQELLAWGDDAQLRKLLEPLQSATEIDRFMDYYSEAVLARLFLKHGCEIEVEVPTVPTKKGDFKNADLKVTKHNQPVYVHVKRVNPDAKRTAQSNIAKRFEPLEKIKRPLRAGFFLFRDITDQEAHSLVRRARPFLKKAELEDAGYFEDDRGRRLAECRVLGQYPDHVKVSVHYGLQEVTNRKRIESRLGSARDQFMPNEINLVFLTGRFTIMDRKDNVEEIESVLLGRTTADAISPSMATVDTGRSPNGFWSRGAHPDCHGVCYFDFELNDNAVLRKLWIRQGSETKIPKWLTALFP